MLLSLSVRPLYSGILHYFSRCLLNLELLFILNKILRVAWICRYILLILTIHCFIDGLILGTIFPLAGLLLLLITIRHLNDLGSSKVLGRYSLSI
jgi:ABC-type transport system involved in cytochrome bd biosynthesis fused ATPase/permease subunit